MKNILILILAVVLLGACGVSDNCPNYSSAEKQNVIIKS